MDEKIFCRKLLMEILEHYEDIEDVIIHGKERQGEWEDPTFDKTKRLIDIQQKLHSL